MEEKQLHITIPQEVHSLHKTTPITSSITNIMANQKHCTESSQQQQPGDLEKEIFELKTALKAKDKDIEKKKKKDIEYEKKEKKEIRREKQAER